MNERMPTSSTFVLKKAMEKARSVSESPNIATEQVVEKITPRQTLEDFASRPLTVAEFNHNYFKYQTWLTSAMVAAGYPLQEVDDLIKKSLGKIDLDAQTVEKNVDDINRIVNNFYIAISTPKAAVQETVAASPAEIVPTIPPPESPVVVSVNQVPPTPNYNSTKSILQAIENETSVSSDTVQEFYESKAVRSQNQILPEPLTVPVPIEQPVTEPPLPTLVLTPEQRVDVPEVAETALVAPIEAQATPPEDTNNYRNKLEQLASQPFNHDAYIELTFDIHAGLRAKYDGVVQKARAGLKRYSETYIPSKTEKEALQFLSRLQAQYVMMQKADSKLGVLRAELMNALETVDPATNEINIKTSTENYLLEVEKFLSKIEALENLIEVAHTEEKPPVIEAYRAQLGRLQFEGNQVLATVSTDHPLYDQFKSLINEDLSSVQVFTAAEQGNEQTLDLEKNFFTRRDRIKAAILYLKTEQDFNDFNSRTQKQLDELTRKADSINPSSSDGVHTKESLVAILQELKTVLHKNNHISPQATLSFLSSEMIAEHTEGLKNQKQDSKNMIGAAKVFFNELGVILETEPTMQAEVPVSEVFKEPDSLPAKFLAAIKNRTEQVRNLVQPTESMKARLQTVLASIPSKKIGEIATLAAFLAYIPTSTSDVNQQNFSTELSPSPLLIAQNGISVAPQFNFDSVLGYLRTDTSKETPVISSPELTTFVVPKAVAPIVDTIAPTMPTFSTPVEVVPGVVFGSSDSQVAKPEVPDLKIFSTQADQVPVDDGIVFEAPVEEVSDIVYKINIGDTFWDINEGETLAGKLPVMSQINPYFKQALIDRVRDRINADSELREKIGGMGDSADELHSDEYINLTELNDLAERLAVEYGYLS